MILAFYTERGASHLRARCARGSAYRRCSLQFAPRPSSASQPPCWLDANSRKPVAAISEPGPRFQSAILAYVILQLSLCHRAKFLRLRRARSTAADVSTPRGCASCAHLRGVYLSFSKAHSCQQQGERKHKHYLLSCLVLCRKLHVFNCDCFGLLRLQLLHIAAGLESSSGDSERPFLRSSFCKGLYYSFVEHFSA